MQIKHDNLQIHPPTWVDESAYATCFKCYAPFASVGKPHHCTFDFVYVFAHQ
jgi:hypothetical protein